MILRTLTSARNYANLSRPKKQNSEGVLNADKNRQIIMKYVFDEKYTMLQP